ncbi:MULTISPECIES: asparaginase domain-containing protein [Asticcacaulis]|uniref:asparaginase domain-containing protein n=1 Tax=Asticcacaulis TaxID=76890 RepID=UPI001AE6BF67|nr:MULTISPECIES: asparaginase domain-containing protein [Asticcacaulis]MBP2160376.1 L-asparaginase [Asticcacaulis solisilvae]MDR6801321.1 L-asparaginase [Asticcacaulis sp. BE141]
MDTSKIQIFTTGGTIDKSYFDGLSQYQFDRSKIGELIRHASVSLPFEITELMAKDSLELTDEDRERIAEAVSNTDATRIIITHGTDSMAVTADRLAALGLDKTVALTGAFLPARYADSDAAFNLGMAFATVQTAPVGVYIVMNGTVFPAGGVIKDRAQGTFRTSEG